MEWSWKTHLGCASSGPPIIFQGKFYNFQILFINTKRMKLPTNNPQLGSLIGATAYNFGTLFIKLSILTFYMKFSAHRRIQNVLYLVMFITVGYNLSGILCLFYLCTPIRRYWDFSVEGKCLDLNGYFIANSAMNVATDVILLILPIWLLKPLRVPKRQKIGVTIVLMMGSL